MTGSPCKGCISRSSICHIEGNCPAYDKWKKQTEIERLNIIKEKETQSQYKSFVIMCRNTALREKRSKK